MTNRRMQIFEIIRRDHKFYATIERCDKDYIVFGSSSNGKLGVRVSGSRLRKLGNEIYIDPILISMFDDYINGRWEEKRQLVIKRIYGK